MSTSPSHRRSIPRWLAPSFLLIALNGCAAIHSDAVQNLIEFQTGKVNAAAENIAAVKSSTSSMVDSYRLALKDIEQNAIEDAQAAMARAIAKSSKVKPDGFKAADFGKDGAGNPRRGTAFFNNAGGKMLEDPMGLDPRIVEQYEQDFAALKKTAAELEASWEGIQELQKQVQGYSERSLFASIDREFIAAVATEIPGSAEYLEKAVKAADKINDVLEKAEDQDLLKTPRTRMALEDLIRLLEESAPEDVGSGDGAAAPDGSGAGSSGSDVPGSSETNPEDQV